MVASRLCQDIAEDGRELFIFVELGNVTSEIRLQGDNMFCTKSALFSPSTTGILFAKFCAQNKSAASLSACPVSSEIKYDPC